MSNLEQDGLANNENQAGLAQQSKKWNAKRIRSVLWSASTSAFLSPIVWLSIVQVCVVASLYAVGYLSLPDQNDTATKALEAVLDVPRDMAAHRALLAYSGVTLGFTWALAILSIVWAISAFVGWRSASTKAHSQRHRFAVLLSVMGMSGAFYLLLTHSWLQLQPFPTSIGQQLLDAAYSAPKGTAAPNAPLGSIVPTTMFLLAIAVPAVLAAGAGFLSEELTADSKEWLAHEVGLRLRELDYLLYIGALAMVFGTLQLSTTMSVPLASLPKVVDLKVRMDLCKTLVPAPASSPFLEPHGSAPTDNFGVQACQKLPKDFAVEQGADSLRQLVRSVTLALGISFSAMLVAIYVPALVRLRLMVETGIEETTHESQAAALKQRLETVGEVDPLRRIATVAATLGPFIAGVIANAFGGS